MSSIAPEMMINVFQRLHTVSPNQKAKAEETISHDVHKRSQLLKEGGSILLRDYAVGDMAQIRFEKKKDRKKIQDNFYVRKDGTRSYFFSTGFDLSLLSPFCFDLGADR